MENENEVQEIVNSDFPSSGLLVLLYCLGAVISLACAFLGFLSSSQSTNCLLISWLLALGALGMNILSEHNSDEEKIRNDF